MKIYFGASFSLDRSKLPLYKKIVETVKELGHEVISEHVVDPKIKIGDGLSAEKLFERETKLVDKADLMLAEISLPSWGTAFLMEHALKTNTPVLALFYKDSKQRLPMMIEGNKEFYVEHYSEDNLFTVLKKNLKYFDQRKHISGKMIVLDGADGSGKATQTQLLLGYLKKKRIKHKYISFPRYHTSFHGQHTGRFLSGEFGGNNEVNPYLSSLAFALDRLTAKEEMMEWLQNGNVVVADRYVTSSMAHQASKLPRKEQEAFIDWIYQMEYKEHKLPQEDIVLFLHVPAQISQKLLEKKQDKKKFLKGKDKAEADVSHQQKSIEMYKKLAQRFNHWHLIECVDEKGEILSREEIHKLVLKTLKKAGLV